MAQFVNTTLAFSKDANVQNFKLESLAVDPVVDANAVEGRMWYNSTDKAFKGFKRNANGDIVIEPLGGGANTLLGIPSDGTWDDGLLSFTENTKVADGVDDINEILKDLAPAKPVALSGALTIPSTKTGKIADASGVNLINLTAGQQVSTIVTNSTMTVTLPTNGNTSFGEADTGKLEYFQDGAKSDEFDLQSTFNEAQRRGSQTYPATAAGTSAGGKIKINSISWYNNFAKWQRGTGQLNVSGLSAGEHTIQCKHITPALTASTSLATVFFDDSTLQPTASNITVAELNPMFKTVSGVKYYATGSTFNVNTTAANCFSKTYLDNPLTISGNGVNSFDVTLGDAAISGVSPIPKHNETITLANKPFTLNATGVGTTTQKIGVVARNATKTSSVVHSADYAHLIDTTTGTSTDLIETFFDETYRLPIDTYDTVPTGITGKWTSTTLLSNGNALVGFKALSYPKLDYTAFAPTNTANYAAFTGNQVYLRAIKKSGTPKSSGTLQLKGIASADIGTKYKVEIKLPTQTGWLDMGVAFNSATYTGAEGQGCLISKSDAGGYAVFNYSVGTKTTANSGFTMIVRVTLINNTVAITELKETAW